MGQTGRRASKLQRLVDDFAETCRFHGIEVSRPVIEHGLRDRIDMVAQHMGVTTTTALRSYFDDSWGREMAQRFCADVEVGEARLAAASDAALPAGFLGRLVAALGQAHFFAAVNTGPLSPARRATTGTPDSASDPVETLLGETTQREPARFDSHMAADATTGLGLALHSAGTGLEVAEVWVPGRVLAQTREVLEDLARRLEPGPGQWRACGCEGPCDEEDTPTLVRDAVRQDLELLYRALDQTPTDRPSVTSGEASASDAGTNGEEARVLQFVRSTKTGRETNRRGK